MSLDTSLSGWLDELRHSEAAIKPYLDDWKRAREGFTGRAYKSGSGKNAPENYALEWFSLRRNELLGNPRVRWTSDIEGDAQARALALTHACNTLSRRTRMRDLNEQLFMDYGFKWAVAVTNSAPVPGFEDGQHVARWPATYRISPLHFRYDTAASRIEARAWNAHLVIASRKKLMMLAGDPKSGWDKDALDRMKSQDVKRFREEGMAIPDRDEVAYWEIHDPGFDLDESPGIKKGYHGTIFTVADLQAIDVGWIRKPRPYFGMPWGPYTVGGDYLVPDESAPMGALTAAAQQGDFLNRVSLATIRAIEAYKNLIVTRNGSNLAELIKNGESDWVFTCNEKDLKEALATLTVGGATEQHFAAKVTAQATLDQVLGVTDLQRGRINPDNKATQEALAAQASGSRTSGTMSKFHDMVSRIMYSWGYLIDRDDEIEIELGPQAAGMFLGPDGKPTTKLKGGLHKDQKPEEFFSLDLSLEVGSMERDLDQDAAMRQASIDSTLQGVYGLGAVFWVSGDVQKYLDTKAELTGVRELKTIIDVQVLKQLGMLMLTQGQGGEAPPAQAQSTPRPVYGRAAGGGGAPPAPKVSTMASKAPNSNSGGQSGAKALTRPKPVGAAA